MVIEANTIPQNGAQLAGLVEDMVNIFGNEAAQEDFVESLAKSSHRELQSSITEKRRKAPGFSRGDG